MSNINYKLREFNKNDINSIAKYANNENIAKWLTDEFPNPYSKKDAENFIDIASKEKFMKVFAIEVANEAVGSIALNFSQINDKNNYNNYENLKTAELGYWLAEKYWNKGIITLAIKDIVEYGFNNYEINCIYATPFKENIASQKVLKKTGFKTDSKLKTINKKNKNYEVIIYTMQNNIIRIRKSNTYKN